MTPEGQLAVYVMALLSGLATLVVHWEFRRRRFRHDAQPDRIFRCGECAEVYTDDADVDLSKCPRCNRMNEPYQF